MAATGYDREAVKRKFFAAAYGRPRDADTKVGRAVAAAYPAVWEFTKRVNRSARGALACEMQKVESFLVIRRACGRLMREVPAVPLLTLHDSLVTTAAHVGVVEAALREEFEACYGVSPALSTKSFADENG